MSRHQSSTFGSSFWSWSGAPGTAL